MISIIVPCYNESEIIQDFLEHLHNCINNLDEKFELIIIDNGSIDDTYNKIESFSLKKLSKKIIVLSNYFGKEAAILAGLDNSEGDACIIMDPDLEDPPEKINEMIQLWKKGYDVVLTKRSSEKISLIKKTFKFLFYKLLLNFSPHKNILENSGDFRLLDKKIYAQVRNMRERVRFLRGLVSYAGYNQTFVNYDKPFRKKGHSKSNYSFLFKYAMDSLFSTSGGALKLITVFGFSLLIFCIVFSIILLIQKLMGQQIPGITTIIFIIMISLAFNIISLGLIGEYVSRIYEEVKERPHYIIKKIKTD